MISCKTILFICMSECMYICSMYGHYHPIICALQDQNIDINHDPAPIPIPFPFPFLVQVHNSRRQNLQSVVFSESYSTKSLQ